MQNKLTKREKEITDLLLDGKVPKDIAGILNIAYDTVLFHQKKIYNKLDVHNINELLAIYTPKKHDTTTPPPPTHTYMKSRRLSLKIVFPIAAAAILALVILLSVWAVRKLSAPGQLVITFNENHPHAWKYDIHPNMFYYDNKWRTSPFQLGAGNKINQGDTFFVTLHFTPHIDLDELFVLLHDFTVPTYEDNLHDISYHCYFGRVKAGTEYKIGKILTATRNAGSEQPMANVFSIYAEAKTQPTVTFTKLEIVKID